MCKFSFFFKYFVTFFLEYVVKSSPILSTCPVFFFPQPNVFKRSAIGQKPAWFGNAAQRKPTDPACLTIHPFSFVCSNLQDLLYGFTTAWLLNETNRILLPWREIDEIIWRIITCYLDFMCFLKHQWKWNDRTGMLWEKELKINPEEEASSRRWWWNYLLRDVLSVWGWSKGNLSLSRGLPCRRAILKHRRRIGNSTTGGEF